MEGLAVRVPLDDGFADLLSATTGTGRLSRFLLRPGRKQQRSYTTLLPYRSPTGALLLAALPRAGGGYLLACASPRSPWRVFGTLIFHGPPAGDSEQPIRFDPVVHPLADLPAYEWVSALREPA